ncbi:hypothetical protein K523DRAFT_358627 [Schizophyllum commune Tattone D]|nr:hypothetical protein K523DRAFT_358627 [Schizophyllum commune Tattone D]
MPGHHGGEIVPVEGVGDPEAPEWPVLSVGQDWDDVLGCHGAEWDRKRRMRKTSVFLLVR